MHVLHFKIVAKQGGINTVNQATYYFFIVFLFTWFLSDTLDIITFFLNHELTCDHQIDTNFESFVHNAIPVMSILELQVPGNHNLRRLSTPSGSAVRLRVHMGPLTMER